MRYQCLSEQIAAAPIPMEITPTQRVLSACVGVLATNLVVTPMDVVKTRVQAAQAETVGRQFAASRSSIYGPPLEPCDKCRQQGRLYTTSARASAAPVASTAMESTAAAAVTGLEMNGSRLVNPARSPSPLPSGTIAALYHIARREGPRGLYRGLDVALLMAVPATVLYYAVYDDMLGRLEAAGAGKVMAPITSGASARILSTVCMAPLELVRTRVQSERASTTAELAARGPRAASRGLAGLPMASVGRAVVTVVREEGVLALWRGVGTTMWRDVPFSMIYWLGYENLKDGFGCRWRHPDETAVAFRGQDSRALREGEGRPRDQSGSADFLLRSFAAGAVSGVVASLLTHPFDVVKTQQQLVMKSSEVGGCEHRPPPPRRHPGTFEVMRSIVESQGPRGLFTGALARVGKVAPACGIMIFSYEAGKRFFSSRNAEAAAQARKQV